MIRSSEVYILHDVSLDVPLISPICEDSFVFFNQEGCAMQSEIQRCTFYDAERAGTETSEMRVDSCLMVSVHIGIMTIHFCLQIFYLGCTRLVFLLSMGRCVRHADVIVNQLHYVPFLVPFL